jgi:predicted N-acyltransferase
MSSPRLSISGNWPGFVSALSKSRREGERRKARKLLDRENGQISISVGAVDNIDDRLADCWAVSSRTWKHETGSSIASSPERIRFYESIAKSNRNWLVLGLLHRGGDAIAFEYNLLEKGVLYNLKLGFDERFRSLSPGQVLRFKMLEWAFENDVNVFDFMGNAADYKVAYSSEILTHRNLRVYSSTPRARLLAAYEFDVRPLLRAVKANLSVTKKA